MSTLEEHTSKQIAALSDAIQALAPSASRAEPPPGPWAVDPDGDVEDAQRANVALVMHSGRTEGARLANARLIAAAPDLLAAARAFCDSFFGYSDDPSGWLRIAAPLVADLRAAVARAERSA